MLTLAFSQFIHTMSSLRTMQRVFNLISQLQGPIGCSKKAFCEHHEIVERTFERYIELLEDFGFVIQKHKGRFYLEKSGGKFTPTPENIQFTPEEATVIKDALVASNVDSPLKNEILPKLYALSGVPELAETIYVSGKTKGIKELRQAIEQKKQVRLNKYFSGRTGSEMDRVVEPVKFIQYYKYLIAFETRKKETRHFKISRIQSVTLLNKSWEHEEQHNNIGYDHFGMKGDTPFVVNLELSGLAYRLLIEEYPPLKDKISPIENGQYNLITEVMAHEGIGRFIMGLAAEITIHEPESLKKYIQKKIKKFKDRHYLSNS